MKEAKPHRKMPCGISPAMGAWVSAPSPAMPRMLSRRPCAPWPLVRSGLRPTAPAHSSMNAQKTRSAMRWMAAAIRAAMPDCAITTDMFTGFHGETEEDFQETLSLMREVGFDAAFMFKYSERPGTLASKVMPDNIPEEVKIERLNRMIALQGTLSLESNRADIGKEFEVLVEGVSKRSTAQWIGRTQQNKMCVFPRGDFRVGDTIRVRVTDATSATLLCELC